MDNKNKGYETCEEEEGYGEEYGFSSSEEYDLKDDCEAELDEITETLDPHRDIEVAVDIEAVIEHYRTTKQKRRMPPIKNPEKVLEQHGDGEENNHHDGKETYLDNSDVDSLDEEIIEDGTVELRRTLVRLPRDALNEYKKLNDYAKDLVDTNPGTSVDIETEHIGTGIPPYFKRMYVCLATVREGFLDGCRKYLGFDGCFLKGVVKGMLLTAVGKDTNNQMFLLAWTIVETESQSSWTWFLEHLKVDIRTKDGGEWTFMSDKQKEKFIAAYNHPIKVVGSEEFWPNSDRGELSPPLPKPMHGRPKKARRRRKYEPKKSKTKLSRHGRDMHCGNCNSNTHNSKTVHPPRMMQVHQEPELAASVRNEQRQLLESASAPRHGNWNYA
nr:hypothetical protein [Tanacetum cinerariifolium]